MNQIPAVDFMDVEEDPATDEAPPEGIIGQVRVDVPGEIEDVPVGDPAPADDDAGSTTLDGSYTFVKGMDKVTHNLTEYLTIAQILYWIGFQDYCERKSLFFR